MLAALGLCACKKEAPAETSRPVDAVPISRDPRDAAAQLSAAQRAAAAAGQNNARQDEAVNSVSE